MTITADTLDEQELSKAGVEALAQRGRDSLFFLTRGILGFDKVTSEIHLPVTHELEDFQENNRLLIMLPRDWYKTTIGTICYAIWRAINDAEIRILLVQNTYTNAVSKLAAIKQIFERNELFRACYPEILPTSSCTWSKESLCLNRVGTFPESTFEAAGTSTAVTSRHYDLIIEDDTVAPDFDNITGAMMQPSQAEIEKCIGWHKLAHPLLIEPATSQLLVIGTRWVEGDLLGWIMDNEPQYKIIQRACRENDAGEPDPDGKIVWPRTDDGRPKFNEKVLQQLEDALGPYMYSALYLNSPTSSANMLFKKEWIHYYEEVPQGLLYCTSLDPASEEDSSSDPDFTSILTTGFNPKNGHIYIIHYNAERMNPGEQVYTLFDHYIAYKPLRFYLEAIQYQRSLAYWMEQEMNRRNIHFLIEQVKGHKASKKDRIKGLQPYFAATKIFLKAEHKELENEILKFPYGKHDDIIDSLSMQLPFFIENAANVVPKYKERKYEAGSAAWIIDKITKRRKKFTQFPYDVGNMLDRVDEKDLVCARLKDHGFHALPDGLGFNN
jgi:phage terminase large subunit-like protein